MSRCYSNQLSYADNYLFASAKVHNNSEIKEEKNKKIRNTTFNKI